MVNNRAFVGLTECYLFVEEVFFNGYPTVTTSLKLGMVKDTRRNGATGSFTR